jgi:hypothetical protein
MISVGFLAAAGYVHIYIFFFTPLLAFHLELNC